MNAANHFTPRTDQLRVNALIGDNDSELDYSDLKIVATLAKARSDIYLTYSSNSNQFFGLKFFAAKARGKVSDSFKVESKFIKLNHPNLIQFKAIQEDDDKITKNVIGKQG